MEEFLINEISIYGPFAVLMLLLLPLGEDLIIIPAGMLIANGTLDPWLTAVCAYLGVILSDTIWYYIGYHYGTPVIHKRWFKRTAHPRRLLEAKHHIERRGAWVIVISRFIPGSRTTVICMSGMLHLPAWKFFLAECTCVLLTVPTQLGLGYLIAHGIGSVTTAQMIFKVLAVIAVMIALTFIIGFISRRWVAKHRAPRAKAAWLKRFRSPRVPRPRLAAKKARPAIAGQAASRP
jgi:membrane protein DedA with SNARE-associated domain